MRHKNLRYEIQALRAVAVVAVVIDHVWPKILPGGYLGVDVFFVLSGFLIVGHLQREIETRGRVHLLAFWARRARRLLPAALLVLTVTGAAVIAWVPSTLWKEWLSHIGASAGYVQNWMLALSGADYSAEERTVSPVQHFWSLSAEEQFYLVVPVLFVLLGAAGRKTRGAAAVVLGVIAAASLLYAAVRVAHTSPSAYFETTTRAWEFAAGGLLALTPVWRARPALRSAVSWTGLVALAACLALFGPGSPVPGPITLLPVAATLAVIAAGTPSPRWSPARLLSSRPVQTIGDLSYSIYLWHWPLIVLAPFVAGAPLPAWGTAVLLVLTAALAWVTKRFVEDPVRRGRLANRPPWMSIVAGLLGSTLILSGCTAVYAHATASASAAATAVAKAVTTGSPCIGGPAGLPASACERPYAVTATTSPTQAAGDLTAVTTYPQCQQVRDEAEVLRCEVGDTTRYASTVALVGDSHMTQYLDALNVYGAANRLRFVSFTKSYCPGTASPDAFVADPGADGASTDCARWGDAVLRTVARDRTIGAVVFSDFTERYVQNNPHEGTGRALSSQDFERAWQRLRDAGKRVVAIRDIPNLQGVNGPECVAAHLTEYDPCATPRSQALWAGPNPLLDAAHASGVPVVELTDVFCDASLCHAVIGGLVVYADSNHMSTTFSRSMAPVVGPRLQRALDEVAPTPSPSP